MNHDDHDHKLLEAYFLGTLSSSEMEALDKILQENAMQREAFASMARLDTNLREEAMQYSHEHLESLAPQKHTFAKSTIVIGLAAAALVIVGAFLIWPKPRTLPPIAHITELGGSLRWTGDGGRVSDGLTRGKLLRGGTLESLSVDSWAEITYLDGSKLALSGQSSITISQNQGKNIVHLREGNLSAEITPKNPNSSMEFMTPTAEAEVSGTRFTMMAHSSATRLTVYEGEVRVTRLADGSRQDVPADHFVLSTLDTTEDFAIVPRERYVNSWKSELPLGVHHGNWIASQGVEPGRLRAKPLLWREYGEHMVLFLAALSATGESRPTALLTEGAHVRVSGRIEVDCEVFFGLTTHRVGGEFGGKYITSRKLRGSNDRIEIDLPLSAFARQYPCFPETLIGHQLVDWWALTINKEAGP